MPGDRPKWNQRAKTLLGRVSKAFCNTRLITEALWAVCLSLAFTALLLLAFPSLRPGEWATSVPGLPSFVKHHASLGPIVTDVSQLEADPGDDAHPLEDNDLETGETDREGGTDEEQNAANAPTTDEDIVGDVGDASSADGDEEAVPLETPAETTTTAALKMKNNSHPAVLEEHLLENPKRSVHSSTIVVGAVHISSTLQLEKHSGFYKLLIVVKRIWDTV